MTYFALSILLHPPAQWGDIPFAMITSTEKAIIICKAKASAKFKKKLIWERGICFYEHLNMDAKLPTRKTGTSWSHQKSIYLLIQIIKK